MSAANNDVYVSVVVSRPADDDHVPAAAAPEPVPAPPLPVPVPASATHPKQALVHAVSSAESSWSIGRRCDTLMWLWFAYVVCQHIYGHYAGLKDPVTFAVAGGGQDDASPSARAPPLPRPHADDPNPRMHSSSSSWPTLASSSSPVVVLPSWMPPHVTPAFLVAQFSLAAAFGYAMIAKTQGRCCAKLLGVLLIAVLGTSWLILTQAVSVYALMSADTLLASSSYRPLLMLAIELCLTAVSVAAACHLPMSYAKPYYLVVSALAGLQACLTLALTIGDGTATTALLLHGLHVAVVVVSVALVTVATSHHVLPPPPKAAAAAASARAARHRVSTAMNCVVCLAVSTFARTAFAPQAYWAIAWCAATTAVTALQHHHQHAVACVDNSAQRHRRTAAVVVFGAVVVAVNIGLALITTFQQHNNNNNNTHDDAAAVRAWAVMLVALVIAATAVVVVAGHRQQQQHGQQQVATAAAAAVRA